MVKNKKNVIATNKKKRGLIHSLKNDYQLWIMLLPAIIVILLFNYLPMYGIQLAFREYDFTKGITGGAFVGLKYFKQFITNFQFFTLMKNTVTLCLANIIFGFPAPIILALMINQIRKKRLKGILQTTVYLPHFISMVVMVSLLLVLLNSNTGVIGKFLSFTGLAKFNLIGSTATFLGVYVVSEIWQHCGWNSIIYLSALSSVDTGLYDACKIDGANRFQIVRYVDIPALVPTIVILFILQMGNILNTGFEKIFLMQNNLNLPVSEVISTYTYKIGIKSNQFSYSAAIGLFNTLINFIFLIAVNKFSKKAADISIF
ncbi:ABC transporter, permease protein [Lachnospiraceae bacterium KM106-2]|nr:ABC transporter, permease protein [Lachnospiraceae bacterium KM106-2]